MYVCMYVCVHGCVFTRDSQRTTFRTSFLPPCGLQGSNSDLQSWPEVPVSTEPSRQPKLSVSNLHSMFSQGNFFLFLDMGQGLCLRSSEGI